MKVYAMSDIHGHIYEFQDALSKVDLSGNNMLILLGDYVHGPDSYSVLDKIMDLQNKYGSDKVIALLGNHEEMVLHGYSNIDERGYLSETEHDDDKYISWMSNLPYYHVVKDVIFVHAGIDEEAAAEGYWELGTSEYIYTGKYPAEVGKISNFDIKIVAGHVGTYDIAGDDNYHDILFDGENHYYIDGTVKVSGEIPVLMYDTDGDKFYRVTDSGQWLIMPYSEENL